MLSRLSVSLALALTLAPPALCQDPAYITPTDRLRITSAAAIAGAEAGRTASVRGSVLGTAAATFLLTPFIGGVGSVIASSELPADVPVVMSGPDPACRLYREAYRETFREEFAPRRRRAMRITVLVTTGLTFVSAAAFGG